MSEIFGYCKEREWKCGPSIDTWHTVSVSAVINAAVAEHADVSQSLCALQAVAEQTTAALRSVIAGCRDLLLNPAGFSVQPCRQSLFLGQRVFCLVGQNIRLYCGFRGPGLNTLVRVQPHRGGVFRAANKYDSPTSGMWTTHHSASKSMTWSWLESLRCHVFPVQHFFEDSNFGCDWQKATIFFFWNLIYKRERSRPTWAKRSTNAAK